MKINPPGDKNHKKEIIKSLQQLSNQRLKVSIQLLCNFQVENLCDFNQLAAVVEMELLITKPCIWEVLWNRCRYWKGTVCLRLCSQSFIKKFNQKFNDDQIDICNRPLQILAFYTYKRIYLVWWLWLIMEEIGAILVVRVFMGPKRINEESVWFCL